MNSVRSTIFSLELRRTWDRFVLTTRARIHDWEHAARGEYLQSKGIYLAFDHCWLFLYLVCSLSPLSSAALIVPVSSQLLFNNLPLLAIIYPTKSMLSTPLHVTFSATSFLIHYLLAFNLSSQFRVYFYPFKDHTPVSYPFLYSISLLAPAASLFYEVPLEVAVWWSYTPLIVYVVHVITNSVDEVDGEIANLEGMTYMAPGAWTI